MNRADCEFVDTWLDDWVAGSVPAAVGDRVFAHLGECDRCRQLEAIVRHAIDRPAVEDVERNDVDLFDAVVSQTSGNRACAQAEAALPALVDGELDASSLEIVSSHLAHCGACSQLAAAMTDAREVLPSLAEVEPPPGFDQLVFSRTSRAPRRSGLAEWWMRLLLRPRASLELAYVGAVLIVVLVGNPVIAFRGAEQQARHLVASVPVDRISAQLPAKDAAVGLLAGTFRLLVDNVRAIGLELSNQWLHARAIVDAAWNAVADAASWVRTLDWKTVLKGAQQSGQAGNKAPPTKDKK